MEDGFIAKAIHVLGIDDHGHEAFAWLFRFRCCLADEIGFFVESDESIKAGFSRGEIRTKIQGPYAPVLFQPHRHERTATVKPEAEIRARALKSFKQTHMELRRAVNLIAQFA